MKECHGSAAKAPLAGDGGLPGGIQGRGRTPTSAKVQKNVERSKLGVSWEVVGSYPRLTDFFFTNKVFEGVEVFRKFKKV